MYISDYMISNLYSILLTVWIFLATFHASYCQRFLSSIFTQIMPGAVIKNLSINFQGFRFLTNHRQGKSYLFCFAFFWLVESRFSQLGLLKNHDNFTLWIGTRLWYKRTVCICESNILKQDEKCSISGAALFPKINKILVVLWIKNQIYWPN